MIFSKNALSECHWAAGGDHTIGVKTDGTVVAVGANWNGQCNVESWTDIEQVAAGDHYTVGVKTDGTVVAAGPLAKISDWRLGQINDNVMLLSPEDGAVLPSWPPANFEWESVDYNLFKIQFSTDPGFPGKTGTTLIVPFKITSWITATSTLELLPQWQWYWRIIRLVGLEKGVIYWRVLGGKKPADIVFSETIQFTLE